MNRISSETLHSGLKFPGGTTRQIPNFSAMGRILSMYSRGSWKSFSVGWKVGASTRRASSFGSFVPGKVVEFVGEQISRIFCFDFPWDLVRKINEDYYVSKKLF